MTKTPAWALDAHWLPHGDLAVGSKRYHQRTQVERQEEKISAFGAVGLSKHMYASLSYVICASIEGPGLVLGG